MKKHIISFLFGVVLLGVGCGFFPFEILAYDYIDEKNPNMELVQEIKEYPIGPEKKYDLEVIDGRVKITYNSNLESTMKIKATYPKNFFALTFQEKGQYEKDQSLKFKFYENIESKDIRKAIELILKDISKKQFYNYEKTFAPIIEVEISKENLKYIDIDEEKPWN